VANLIAEGLKGKAKLVPPEERAVDAVIAIEGCPTACADLDPFSELPIYRITSREEGERFLSRVGKDLFP